ncbi:MAG TPA: hypothetical protein VFH61_11335, partial [Thermoleophilia bacterium]|nr:hypothetical protein [Thermoleophilia bacterium]
TKALLAEFGFSAGTALGAASKGSKASVAPAVMAAAQVKVEAAVALVKGKRVIDLDDDDDDAVAPAPKGVPKVAAQTAGALTAEKVMAVLNGEATPPTTKPMLASAMPEEQTIEDYANPEWVLEEKFDGHRLMLVVETNAKVAGWSRPGQDRPAALRPLPAKLESDAAHLPVGIYDGELYVPGGTSSDVVRLDRADELRLVLFDAIEVLGVKATDKAFRERRALLELCVKHCPTPGRVHVAEQRSVTLAAVKAIWAAKGEGAIVKKLDGTYRSGYRTPAWVKVKKVSAAELTITGFGEGKNGPCSVFMLRHDDGRETTVKVLTQAMLRDAEKDPDRYIGKRLVISHMGLTKSGKWRHAVLDHILELWDAS